MAVYGRLRAKNGEAVTDFFPKTYANLVYMKGATSKTIQSRIEDIISGAQKVGSSTNSDHASEADSATSADKIDGYDVVIREKGYTPTQGAYKNTIVFIRQT